MSLSDKLTLQNLTPPGYFDLSESAPAQHQAYMSWFQTQLTLSAQQAAALSTLVLSPWLVEFNDSPRAPYLNYLLNTYGMGFFGGTNNQAAALYQLISGSWKTSVLQNIKTIIDAFCLPPFSWFQANLSPMILSGALLPSITDQGFLIYSTNASPLKPANTPYTASAGGVPASWSVPSGWTFAAASAVTYCRGYLVGSNIVWCSPRPVSDFLNAPYFSASIPSSVASAGTICFVNSDGSGDTGAVYYSDGTAWRKTSTSNVNLGEIQSGGLIPSDEIVTVWAPNPSSVPYAIASSVQPPVSGPTQGYGDFGAWSDTSISSNEITIQVTQIAGGSIAIATLLAVLRRIKPVSTAITIEISGVQYSVKDARAIS